MQQVKQLDFSGQTIYGGIDMHKKSWRVNTRNGEMPLKTFSQNPSAEELAKTLQRNYPGATYKLVYEAGFCGYKHQREFSEKGIDCIIVHPADVPTMDKEKHRKSDTVDCRKLSRELSEGSLTGIYIPSIEQQDDRGIIRAYQQFVKDQTRFKNRIKSWLDFQGITIPNDEEGSHWSNNFIEWLKNLSLTPSARVSLDLLLEGYMHTRKMVLTATRQVRALSKEERYKQKIKLLRSIPGIGQIGALLLVTEIGDMKRFKGLDALCDYVGLVPKVHGSGDKTHIGGLTHRGHHELRDTIIEASWVAIRNDPAMTMCYQEYCKRMKKNKAIIKIARKMLNRIRFVMLNQKEYVSLVVQ